MNDAMLKFSGLSESGLLGQGLCVLEDSTVDLTERAKRLRLLDIYGYYHLKTVKNILIQAWRG